MKKLLTIVLLFTIHSSLFPFHCFSQNITADTTLANQYYTKADNLRKASKLDSALLIAQQAQPLYIKHLGEISLKNAAVLHLLGNVYLTKAQYDLASDCYFKSLDIRKKLLGEKHKDIAALYNNIAIVYERKYELDKAIEYHSKCLDIRRELFSEKNAEVITSYRNIGNMYILKTDFNKALEYFVKTLEICKVFYGEKSYEVASQLSNVGAVYEKMDKLDLALEYHSKSLALSIETFGADHLEVARALNNMGVAYYKKTEYDKTLDCYFKSLEIRKKQLGEKNLQIATAYNNIGITYWSENEADKALEYLLKALEIRNELMNGKHQDIATTCGNIGLVYQSKFEYNKALEYLQKSLDMQKELLGARNALVGRTLNNIGVVYNEMGEHNKALEYHQKSLEIKKENFGEKHSEIAMSFINIGNAHKDLLEYDKAIEFYFKALEIHSELLGMKNVETTKALGNLGITYFYKAQYDKALEYYFKALEIQNELLNGKHTIIAQTYNNIAEVYKNTKQYDIALKFYQSAIAANELDFTDTTNVFAVPTITNCVDYTQLLVSLQNKAHIFLDTIIQLPESLKLSGSSRQQLALRYYQAADTLIDKTRIEITSHSDKLTLATKANQIYSEAIDLCMKMVNTVEPRRGVALRNQYNQLAFYFSEKNKSSVLLEALAGQEAQKFAGIPDSLLKIEKKIKFDITNYTNKLATTKQTDSITIRNYNDNLFRANRSYDSLMVVFETQFPSYYDLKYNTKPISVEMLQASVLKDKRSAMISYNVSDSIITIFTLTNKNIDIQQLAKPKKFDEMLQLYRNSLRNPTDKAFQRVYQRFAFNLYNLLFPEILKTDKYKKIKNLIIVPDATLGTIPFETLLTDSLNLAGYENPLGLNNLPYLIRKYSISYSYSANLFYRTFPKQKNETIENTNLDDWLAFAPVFDDNKTEFLALRTREMLQSLTASNDSLTREYFDGNKIAALPGTETEVNDIYNQFKVKNKKAMVLLHSAANKDFALSDSISNYRIVHFATHGFVNSEKPEMSGVLLAQDSTKEDNGMLTANEIYNLKLNADLVILSACETGLGKIVKGEGVIGLTRALLYAGTKNIIVSLWKVSDASTAILMDNFYSEVLKSQTFSKRLTFGKSLQKAKLQMISEGKYAHPFYWSPFILIGK